MDAGVKGNIEGDVKMALALARGWLEGGRIDNSQVRPLDPRIMPGYLHIIYHTSDPACFAFSELKSQKDRSAFACNKGILIELE